MTRRSPEQVHDRSGHSTFVASCARCQTEAEQDRNAEAARAELATGGKVTGSTVQLVGEPGCELIVPDGSAIVPAGHESPLPSADSTGYLVEAEELSAEPAIPRPRVNDRPKCYLDTCTLPEFVDGAGLCGGHWSTRPDLRKVARRG